MNDKTVTIDGIAIACTAEWKPESKSRPGELLILVRARLGKDESSGYVKVAPHPSNTEQSVQALIDGMMETLAREVIAISRNRAIKEALTK